jgi:tetratricopeptide (TPR) repeat protein/DNA-binding CsgD family transcriptional regulator
MNRSKHTQALFYIYTFIIVFFGTTAKGLAQPAKAAVDSMVEALPAAKDDTNKVMLLCEISRAYFQSAPDKGITYGQHALNLADKLEYKFGIMKANLAIGRCHAAQQQLPEALKHFTDALAIAEKLDSHEDIGNAQISISNVYADKKEYDKALAALTEAEKAYNKAGIKNQYFIAVARGNVYMKKSAPQSAARAFAEAIEMEEKYGNSPGKLATAYQNMGSAYTDLKRNDSALIYLFKALQIAKEIGNGRTYLFALGNISGAYLSVAEQQPHKLPDSLKDRKANYQKSIEYGKQAIAMSYELGMPLIRVTTFHNIGQAYFRMGQYKEAYEYNDRYAAEKDSLKTIDMQVAFAKAEAEFQTRRATDSLKYENQLKDSELAKRHSDRNKLIAIISLIGISGLLLINREKLKQQQKRKVAEAETKRAEEYAAKQLADFTRHMQEKNDMIATISAEMEKLKETGGTVSTIDEKLLSELQQSILLTDEQWNEFKATFEKVHPGFLTRLKTQLPDLTPAETRFVVLSKLNLSAREMAGMLGITPPAVRASKYRLLKKLGFDDDAQLDSLIERI